jgi:hypothetical protein
LLLMGRGHSTFLPPSEYHEGVEACYRLAGDAKTETAPAATSPVGWKLYYDFFDDSDR